MGLVSRERRQPTTDDEDKNDYSYEARKELKVDPAQFIAKYIRLDITAKLPTCSVLLLYELLLNNKYSLSVECGSNFTYD